jgi:hypothetical protein
MLVASSLNEENVKGNWEDKQGSDMLKTEIIEPYEKKHCKGRGRS